MRDRTVTPWYTDITLVKSKSYEEPGPEKLEFGQRKRRIEMIDEIRDIGEQTKEVWDE